MRPWPGVPLAQPGPAPHQQPLPDACDVAVIGGGIAGVSAAWELAGQGLRVVLLEKGRVGAEQSGRNWGWIRVQGRDPAEIPLVVTAQRLWQDWAMRLGPELGHRTCGVTYLARHRRDLEAFAAWLPHASEHGLSTRLLSAHETRALLPAARPDAWIGALHTPTDACAEPFVAVPMMARAAAAAGVVIREDCAVRGLDIAAGRVRGVLTEAGRLRADAVILAGGAWSSLLLRAHGVSIPQLSVLSSAAATGPMPDLFAGAAADDRFALRRRADGGYTIAPGSGTRMFLGPDAVRHAPAYRAVLRQTWRGLRLHPAAPRGFPDAWTTPRHWNPDRPTPFEALRVLDPVPHAASLRAVTEAFAAAFPDRPRPVIARAWAGMIDTMPDVVPVLDAVASLPGLVVGTGLSGHGFGIGPAIGLVLAALATGGEPGHDLNRFRLSRFSEPGPLEPGPAL